MAASRSTSTCARWATRMSTSRAISLRSSIRTRATSCPRWHRWRLKEGETVARNLDAELAARPLEACSFKDKGFVGSVGLRRGVADIAGITTGGRLAHLLKDAIEWEYRQSVRHLRGWDPVAS